MRSGVRAGAGRISGVGRQTFRVYESEGWRGKVGQGSAVVQFAYKAVAMRKILRSA